MSSFQEVKYIQYIHYLYPLELAQADELSAKKKKKKKKTLEGEEVSTAANIYLIMVEICLCDTYFSPLSQK